MALSTPLILHSPNVTDPKHQTGSESATTRLGNYYLQRLILLEDYEIIYRGTYTTHEENGRHN